jgi:tRNA(adenine34) deaminase
VDARQGLPTIDLDAFMDEALAEADAAGRAGERPISAVVVIDGNVVSRGRSRQNERRSQLAHAELEALMSGGEPVFTRYDEAVLLTTVEPCPLCLGAVVMADVPHIVYAVADPNAALPPSVLEVPYLRRHIATYRGGVRDSQSLELIARHSPALARDLGRVDAGARSLPADSAST